MHINEFNKLCSDISMYQERACEDLNNVDYINDIRYIFNNRTILTLEKFLYDCFYNSLQVERKILEIPKNVKSSSWHGTEKIGVGTFFGTVPSFRETIRYFDDHDYLFQLIPEYLPLIINEKKREVIKEFIEWQAKYVKEFRKIGFKDNKPLITSISNQSVFVKEPVNFFDVSGTEKHFSVVYDPVTIKNIELVIFYSKMYKHYRSELAIYLLIKDNNNKKVTTFFDLKDVCGDYTLSKIEKRYLRLAHNVEWVEEPFTFTNLSDILNLYEVKSKLYEIINLMKKFDESANELLQKPAKLLLMKGKI